MIRHIALGAALMLAAAESARAAGDAARGEQLYVGCQDCHSLDKNDVGPRHRGVFGRKAGSLSNNHGNQTPAPSGAVKVRVSDREAARP